MFSKYEIVYSGYQGLFFRDGVLMDVRQPGRYRLRRRREEIKSVDVRSTTIEMVGREFLTSDSASIRASLFGFVRVADVKKAYNANVIGGYQMSGALSYEDDSLIDLLKAKLRDWTLAHTLTEALAGREDLVTQLKAEADRVAAMQGVEVELLVVTEFAPSGSIKTALANLLKADLEGQLALSKARHEAATLRSLMNTSRLIKDNPGLLELRLLTTGAVPRLTFHVGSSVGSGSEAGVNAERE
jgi:regulator of protease activity HflC (stomatin/prohibitin superfamily)